MNHDTRGARDVRVALRACVGAAGAALALACASHAGEDRMKGIGVPAERALQVLREYPLRTLAGEAVPLTSLRGSVVVLNFWATWCGPCRKELPRLDALNAEIARQGGRVLAVSIDADRRNVDRFTRQHRLRLPVVHDGPDGLARSLDLDHIPFTIVLDRSGAIVWTGSGSDDVGVQALMARTRALVTATPTAAAVRGEGQP